MIAEIEGTLDEILALNDLPGVSLQRGLHDLGNGRFKANAVIRGDEAKDAVVARGLTVRVPVEDETMIAALDAGSADGGGTEEP